MRSRVVCNDLLALASPWNNKNLSFKSEFSALTPFIKRLSCKRTSNWNENAWKWIKRLANDHIRNKYRSGTSRGDLNTLPNNCFLMASRCRAGWCRAGCFKAALATSSHKSLVLTCNWKLASAFGKWINIHVNYQVCPYKFQLIVDTSWINVS